MIAGVLRLSPLVLGLGQVLFLLLFLIHLVACRSSVTVERVGIMIKRKMKKHVTEKKERRRVLQRLTGFELLTFESFP